MKKITATKIIDNNSFFFECIDEGSGFLDTKVTLNGVAFCWITYVDIEKFLADFSEFIGKYRI